MLSVFLADDEALVRQLVKKLVDWDKLDLTLIGEADNGITACDFICQNRPDIVILDIRMPGYTGLDLVKKVRDTGLDTYFILISGHKQFEYAHEALGLGIQDYLLKPIKKTVLEANLIKAKNAILASRSEAENQVYIHAVLNQSIEKLRLEFIKNLSLGPSPLSLEELNREYHFKCQEGVFQFCIFHLFFPSRIILHDLSEDFHHLQQLLSPTLKSICFDWELYQNGADLTIFLNYSPSNEHRLRVFLSGLQREWNTHKKMLLMSNLIIALGPSSDQVSVLHELYSQAKTASYARLLTGSSTVIFYDSLDPPSQTAGGILTQSRKREFFELAELNQLQSLKNWIDNLFKSTFPPDGPCCPSLLLDLSGCIINLYQEVLNNLHSDQSTAAFNGKEYMAKITSSETMQDVVRCLQDMLDDWQLAPTNNAFIRAVKSYVHSHYGENIRLTDVASSYNVSPAYLSRIFKEETGITFSDYLIQYRIRIAKELLKDISVNVTEVAEQVGYCDSKHFSKSFKAIVGITPKDYRKLYAR